MWMECFADGLAKATGEINQISHRYDATTRQAFMRVGGYCCEADWRDVTDR
jgi:hypothetical protein